MWDGRGVNEESFHNNNQRRPIYSRTFSLIIFKLLGSLLNKLLVGD